MSVVRLLSLSPASSFTSFVVRLLCLSPACPCVVFSLSYTELSASTIQGFGFSSFARSPCAYGQGLLRLSLGYASPSPVSCSSKLIERYIDRQPYDREDSSKEDYDSLEEML